jgi:hypothetical protein
VTTLAEADAAIRQLHARYVDAVFRKDVKAFGDCFTQSCEWRISGMMFRGRAEIEEAIERILGRARRVYMSFGTPILEVGNASAAGRTYVNERCAWNDGKTNISVGRYYERFVDEGDRWRFSWRLFQLHYSGPPDLTGAWQEHPDYGPPPGMPEADVMTADHASEKWGMPKPGS